MTRFVFDLATFVLFIVMGVLIFLYLFGKGPFA